MTSAPTPTNSKSNELEDILYDYVLERSLKYVIPKLEALLQQTALEARLNCLEELVEWQDQETDTDGRAVGEPYYHLSDYARQNIEAEIKTLKAKQERNSDD